MTLSIEDATRFAQVFKGLVDGVSVAVLDKHQAVRLALTTMFAGGHLLLEDAPGTAPWQPLSKVPTRVSSSPPTCCPPTSPA